MDRQRFKEIARNKLSQAAIEQLIKIKSDKDNVIKAMRLTIEVENPYGDYDIHINVP